MNAQLLALMMTQSAATLSRPEVSQVLTASCVLHVSKNTGD